MSLGQGSRLGPYEIVAGIGAGGMGEVYRARDTRLGRDVALKVLPEAFAKDADRLARFEREAKAVAALNHPNILAIFDTGALEGHSFVITELLEGESLRHRLTAGAIPVRKANEIGVQIARGLAAAHSKGIVHRDLKPENIFLLNDGQVKILDFGLARQTSTNSGATETASAITDPGVVMGTVGYMAPEQVRGQLVDARTDLFALGAVLYEMLSGQRAFQRDTAADTMSAILTADPLELTGSRAEISPALERIVRHCLEKNAGERFQSASDVAFALGALSGSTVSTSGHAGVGPVPARRRRALRWVVVALALLAAIAGGAAMERAVTPEVRISFEPRTWDGQWIFNARFMPDGQTIVYSASNETSGQPELFINRPSALGSERLGQPNTLLLAVSSKGELAVLTSPAFTAIDVFEGTLARTTPDSAPRPWLEHIRGADWSPDGTTLAVVRVSGGTDTLEYPIDRPLYRAPAGFLSDLRISPEGKRVAFMEHAIFGDNRGWLKVVDADGTVRTLGGEFSGESGIAWSADGRQIFFTASEPGNYDETFVVNAAGPSVLRRPFAGPVGIQVRDTAASGHMLVTQDDLRTSIRGRVPGEATEREFGWLNLSYGGDISSDHRFLMFTDAGVSGGPDYEASIRDLATSKVSRLGAGAALHLSPDDKWVAAFVSSRNEFVLYPTGPGRPIPLDRGGITSYRSYLQWLSPTRVLVCGTETSKRVRCYQQDISGGAPKPVTGDGAVTALVSPDGHWLVLQTDSGEIRIGAVGESTRLVPNLTPGDNILAWSKDSRSLIVHAFRKPPIRVERFDVASSQRTILRELSPPDPASVPTAILAQWIDDGRGYTYWYTRQNSRLYVVTGAQNR